MPVPDRVLVAIPVFGAADLTDAVLGDLLGDRADPLLPEQLVVVDNAGDYSHPGSADRLTVYRPGVNLRWIGAANWALTQAVEVGADVCIVLNNDVRLSPGFVPGLVRTFADHPDVAIAAACYDDFWLHQRASVIPASAADYRPTVRYRDVPFCDGTAIAFSMAAIQQLGPLDAVAFPRHGYGSDIDLALRARAAGWRCVVTETAYVSHLRKGTLGRIPGESSERNRAEALTGLNAKYGDRWRALAGLSEAAFPPHNQGSGRSWYL